MNPHQQSVHDQFDPQARAYLHSAVHAQGPDLEQARNVLRERLPPNAGAHLLDLGCGAGHLTFALAPFVERAVALDPSAGMLATVAAEAASRGLAHVCTTVGQAEAIPFEAQSFDVVATRYSAHHWHCLRPPMREIHRVLKPGGWLIVIDVVGPSDALADTHLQAMELLRDRSHVRNRSEAQWRGVLSQAGFVLEGSWQWPLRIEFGAWIERMRTPPAKAAMIRQMQQEAPDEVKKALCLEPDGSFTAQTGMFLARRMADGNLPITSEA